MKPEHIENLMIFIEEKEAELGLDTGDKKQSFYTGLQYCILNYLNRKEREKALGTKPGGIRVAIVRLFYDEVLAQIAKLELSPEERQNLLAVLYECAAAYAVRRFQGI